eukprot:g6630.t1
MSGFAGTVRGSFFEAPEWVDRNKAPGTTSQASVYAQPGWWHDLASGKFLPFSPNLVWLAIALLDYVLFPYDFAAARAWAWGWVLRRLLVNLFIVFGYFGFWHVTLYWWGWGARPFNPARQWRWAKLAHNAWYTALGALQWTAWEALFMHCYATGRLPYLADAQALGTGRGALNFVACLFWVPLYRELHFYLAHRLIHIKPLYKYVHSLHHRNTDIEPFAGLCMHPVEHLFYFSCAGPSLYCFASPFAFMWNGVHLLISPAASHSGYEDNMQSDQFHYLHHRFFECNYGTGGIPFDSWFGTFRDRLPAPKQVDKADGAASATYKGAAVAVGAAQARAMDARATLARAPDTEFMFYMLATAAAGGLAALASVRPGAAPLSSPHLLAALVSVGPLALGAAMLYASRPGRDRGGALDWRKLFLYPFHKEKLLGAFGLNTALGLAVTVVPVFHAVHMLLAAPGEGVYCQLWGCPAARS